MTRKRYVKLLMSKGFQIREARLIAKMDVSIHGSYELAELCNSPLMKMILEAAIGNVYGLTLGNPTCSSFLNRLKELEAFL